MQKPVSYSEALSHGLADKRIDILRQIASHGSISQAARAVGVGYKAAWQAIDTLTNLAGTSLVECSVGGAGGGGASLTGAGRQLLAAADALSEARRNVLANWESADGGAAVARLSVRTSMRNQWPCTVQRIEMLGQIARVHLRSAQRLEIHGANPLARSVKGRVAKEEGGEEECAWLCARITRESVQLLGLRPGQAVQALCKATAVRVERSAISVELHGDGLAVSNMHCLQGRAMRVTQGESGDEVVARLAGGLQIVGFAPPHSGLRARSRVTLAVDENALALALGQ